MDAGCFLFFSFSFFDEMKIAIDQFIDGRFFWYLFFLMSDDDHQFVLAFFF